MIKINGKELPQNAIDFELGRLIRFYSQHIPEDQIRQQMGLLRERAKEQAIGAKLLFDEANRLDLPVSDDEVKERIAAIKEQAGGEEKFQEMLKKQGVNAVEFGEQIRRGRRVDKLVEKVTSGISDPTEQDIKDHFVAHDEEYTKSEQAQAQHILIRPANDSPDAKFAAIAKINDLRKRLVDEGADFSELAAAHSECPSGKQAGGSLGWFGRGAMVPEFDAAVFSMKDGELSETIETQFGLHLIKKTGHQDAEKPSFDEVRDSIKEFLRHSTRGEALAAFVADLRGKAKIEEITN